MQGLAFNIHHGRIKRGMAWLLVLTQLAGCAFAPWEHTKPAQKTPEDAVKAAEAQVQLKPDEVKHLKTLHVNKESAVNQLMTLAEQARLAGNIEAAQGYYDRVLAISPAH